MGMCTECCRSRGGFAWVVGISVAIMCLVVLCSTSAWADLTLSAPQYGDCGQVTINGLASGSPDSIAWDWGDGTASDAWFPATHEYSTNDTYTVIVTAQPTGDADQTTVVITNAGSAGCGCSVRLKPPSIVLRDGTTSDQFEVEIRDETGEIVSTFGVPIVFSSSDPGIVSVDASGYVSSTGFGEALITATVAGYRDASSMVYAGSFRMIPQILCLTPGDTALCTVEIRNADGSSVDLSGRTLTYRVETGGSDPSATVNPTTGEITALHAPAAFEDTVGIRAWLDDVIPGRVECLVRVTSDDLDLDAWTCVPQDSTSLRTPNVICGANYLQTFSDDDVWRIVELAYQFENELTGVLPCWGDVQYLTVDPGHDDGTLPCGLSGNPIRLGANVDTGGGCTIDIYGPDPTPQWGIFFHEMGHQFTLWSQKFAAFTSVDAAANGNFIFIEGLATAVSFYNAQMMTDRAAAHAIPQDVVDDIREYVGYFGSHPYLDAYLAGGADWASMGGDGPDILDDMIAVIAEDYGFDSIYRFYSLFLPPHEGLPFGMASETEQSTVFIAAMSVATGQDLRSRFHDDWGFPLDNAYYTLIYPTVRRLVLQRGPEVYAVSDTAAVFRVDMEGRTFADGAVYAAGLATGSADVAEWVSVNEAVEPGSVLELNRVASATYHISSTACSPLVAGVVSTEPGVALGASKHDGPTALLALTGIVPVKVTDEGGRILPGDLLVSSSTPGHAMRWAGREPCPCSLVGKALEPMTDETGMILVLLTAH